MESETWIPAQELNLHNQNTERAYYSNIHVCVYVYITVYTHRYISLSISISISLSLCVYIYICICIHIYMCVYMCTYIHIYQSVCVFRKSTKTGRLRAVGCKNPDAAPTPIKASG